MEPHDINVRKPAYSFVVPIRDEAESLADFHGRLVAAADGLAEAYEIIFVDDGSSDDSEAVLRRLAGDDERVRLVCLSRPFGREAALTAGLDHASGEAAILLEVACRDLPAFLEALAEKWREGCEVVCAEPQDESGRSVRPWTARLLGWFARLLGGWDLTDGSDPRLLDRKAIDALIGFREQDRFLRGLVRWAGFRRGTVPVAKEAAPARRFSSGQLLARAAAGVFGFSLFPVRLAAAVGAVMVLTGVVYAIVSLVLWPLGVVAGPWWNVVVAVGGLFGLQFLFIGLLGEMLGRIAQQTRARPLYVVRHKLGFERGEQGDRSAERAWRRPRRPGAFSIYT